MNAGVGACARCGSIDARPDHDEALIEYHLVFGDDARTDDLAWLCDDCYVAFVAWYRQLTGKRLDGGRQN